MNPFYASLGFIAFAILSLCKAKQEFPAHFLGGDLRRRLVEAENLKHAQAMAEAAVAVID